MSRYGVMQYPTSGTLWERALDKVAGWLVGTLFRVDEALADLGGED